MRIAVNTRFLLSHKMEGFGWYTYEVTKRLVEQHPEVEFIFFFDRPFDQKFIFGKNVTPVVLRPPARHPILFYIWFENSVRRALKKYKVDLFFSPDGYLSLRSDVPQVNVIHDINFEHNPEDLKPTMRKYYQKYFPKFAQKAQHILTVSEYSKQDIQKTYAVSPDKITAIWNGASDAFKPIDLKTQISVREKYSGGNPYLLFVGALHPRKNLIRLLKAFDQIVEEHPEQPHRLLIVGAELWSKGLGDYDISSETEKHVTFTGHLQLEELALVMAAADIFTFVPYFEGFGIPLVEAMRCGTPILSGDRTSLPEVAGDAALYCDPFDVDSIKSGIIRLIQNDTLRDTLRQKGLERSKLFSWDKAADAVWKVLEEVYSDLS